MTSKDRVRLKHRGRAICGLEKAGAAREFPGAAAVRCVDPPGHLGRCKNHQALDPSEARTFEARGTVTGCGAETVIPRASAQGSHLPCIQCGGHFPAAEFVWAGTDEVIGS